MWWVQGIGGGCAWESWVASLCMVVVWMVLWAGKLVVDGQVLVVLKGSREIVKIVDNYKEKRKMVASHNNLITNCYLMKKKNAFSSDIMKQNFMQHNYF